MALPSFLCPHAILSLNDQMTRGPPNQRTRSISPFGLREFRFSNSACSRSISPRVHDPMTCVPLGSMVKISFGSPDFRDFNSQPPLAQNAFSRSPQIPAMCPPRINGPRSLRDFDTSTISNLSPSHFPRDEIY
jgi:hypothetical protein